MEVTCHRCEGKLDLAFFKSPTNVRPEAPGKASQLQSGAITAVNICQDCWDQ